MTDLEDLDELTTDFRGDWSHANKRGKVRGSLDGLRRIVGAAHPARSSDDGRLRKTPITLPAVSIQKRDE